jgi:hypothetical protein
MDDLRTEIRDAFEREQATHPPSANLRYRVVRDAASRPAPGTNLQWMAVAAALLIGALVVVGLMSSRIALRPVPAATPHPTSSAIPDYGQPPAGVPLFYVGDPDHPGWYVGLDWNGVPRGTIKVAKTVEDLQALVQSPDGSGFLITPFKAHSGSYLDRLGSPVGNVDQSSVQQMWSDDSKQLCTLNWVPSRGPWQVGVTTPGGASTSHDVAIDPYVVQSGAIAMGIAACSPAHDRAVITYDAFGYPTIVWVVRLSDGKVLLRHAYDRNVMAGIAASFDGSLLAESSSKSNGYLGYPSAPNTVVRRTSDGSVVATFDPTIGILAFSADDQVVLVSTSPWAAGVPTHLAVIDLATGKVLWRDDRSTELAGYFVEPAGSAFAVMLQDPSDQSLHPRVWIAMAYVQGPSPAIPGRFVRP